MREINREKGRVYNIDNHYYLEKIYDDLLDLINQIAKDNNFKRIDIDKAQRGDVLYYKDNLLV